VYITEGRLLLLMKMHGPTINDSMENYLINISVILDYQNLNIAV